MKYERKEYVLTHQRKDGTIYHRHRVDGKVILKGFFRLDSCESLHCPKCAWLSRTCQHFEVSASSKGHHYIAWLDSPKKLNERIELSIAYPNSFNE